MSTETPAWVMECEVKIRSCLVVAPVEVAIALLKSLAKEGVGRPDIVPTVFGSIVFSWTTVERIATIEITPEGKLTVVRGTQSTSHAARILTVQKTAYDV